jgi:uncharacterized protein YlaN (UPF0358 family)
MEIIQLTQENYKKLELAWDERETHKIECPIEKIRKMFPDIYLGTLFMMFAPTGVGKSSFLMATAKEFAKETKVIYISTEESKIDMYMHFPQNDNITIAYCETQQQVLDTIEYAGQNDIHYVFYDYIGSTGDFDWTALKDEADKILQKAIKYEMLVMSAGQAKNELYEDMLNPDELKIYTPHYISYSKNIATKCAYAMYLCMDKNANVLKMWAFKNRHGLLDSNKYLAPLNRATRTWE